MTFGTTIVTAPGGQYQLCWCFGQCIREEHFVVTVGTFELIGPQALMGRTCIAGQSCVVDDVIAWSYNDTSDTLGTFDTLAYVAHGLNGLDGAMRFTFDLITSPGGPELRTKSFAKSLSTFCNIFQYWSVFYIKRFVNLCTKDQNYKNNKNMSGVKCRPCSSCCKAPISFAGLPLSPTLLTHLLSFHTTQSLGNATGD